MKNLMKRAHELTRKIKREFPEVDYKTQLGISLSFLYKEGVDKMITFKANNGMTVEIELEKTLVKNLIVGGVELVKNATEESMSVYVTREFIVINSSYLCRKLGVNTSMIKIAINNNPAILSELDKDFSEYKEKEQKERNKIKKMVEKYGDIDLKDNFNDFITNPNR